MFLVSLLLLQPNLKYFQPQTYLDVTDNYYLSDEFAKWKISKTSFEFVPKGVATRIEAPLNITQLDISRDQIATEPVSIVQGQPIIKIIKNTPSHKVFNTLSNQASKIQINSFNYPDWKLYIDGALQPIDDNNRLKLIQAELKPGQHTLELKFKNTFTRNIANLTTVFSAILLLLIQPKINHFLTKK